MELETQVLITHRLSYLEMGQIEPVLSLAAEVGRMLSGLANKLNMTKLTPDT